MMVMAGQYAMIGNALSSVKNVHMLLPRRY